MVGVLDYGMGNLASVKAGLLRAGATNVEIVKNAGEIGNCDALVIPGVGAFAAAMEKILGMDATDAIKAFAKSGKPILGICLGMQVLFEEGEEGGRRRGLGLIEGKVKLLEDAPKLPQIGWNAVSTNADGLWSGIGNLPYFYFVHSYACFPENKGDVIGTTAYGDVFASAVRRENVIGVQFHPEKSGADGLKLLKNFLEMVGKSE
ncbi:imidazole glycerol phosphate synthase subunit HisH [Candidatus Parvarchaeota archaeon]|nr:imidazole glycerol phosphate synthase subunit HisH [Candidatus Parvarchaeota archaeon]